MSEPRNFIFIDRDRCNLFFQKIVICELDNWYPVSDPGIYDHPPVDDGDLREFARRIVLFSTGGDFWGSSGASMAEPDLGLIRDIGCVDVHSQLAREPHAVADCVCRAGAVADDDVFFVWMGVRDPCICGGVSGGVGVDVPGSKFQVPGEELARYIIIILEAKMFDDEDFEKRLDRKIARTDFAVFIFALIVVAAVFVGLKVLCFVGFAQVCG